MHIFLRCIYSWSSADPRLFWYKRKFLNIVDWMKGQKLKEILANILTQGRTRIDQWLEQFYLLLYIMKVPLVCIPISPIWKSVTGYFGNCIANCFTLIGSHRQLQLAWTCFCVMKACFLRQTWQSTTKLILLVKKKIERYCKQLPTR